MARLPGYLMNDAERDTGTPPPSGNGLQPLIRPRLCRQFDTKSVIFIHGYPGAGKKTVVKQYLRNRKADFIWLRCSEAIRNWDWLESFLEEADNAKRTIVLEGFDALPPGRWLTDRLEELMLASAATTRWFILSAGAPEQPFTRIRYMKELLVIDNNALSFTPGEIRRWWKKAFSSTLPDQLADRLRELSGGWPLALTCLWESCRDKGEEERLGILEDFLYRKEHSRINRYFHDTLLPFWDEEQRELFTLLSGLVSFTDDMLALARPEIGEMELSRLLPRTAFLQKKTTDQGARWHIHPLLREYLKNRNPQHLTEASNRLFYYKLARHFIAREELEATVIDLCRHGEEETAQRLLSSIGDYLIEKNEYLSLRRLCNALPPLVIQRDIYLQYYDAAADSFFHPRRARETLLKLIPLFASQRDWPRLAMSGYHFLLLELLFTFEEAPSPDLYQLLQEDPLEALHPQYAAVKEISRVIALMHRPDSAAYNGEISDTLYRIEESSPLYEREQLFFICKLLMLKMAADNGDSAEIKAVKSNIRGLLPRNWEELAFPYTPLIAYYLGQGAIRTGQTRTARQHFSNALAHSYGSPELQALFYRGLIETYLSCRRLPFFLPELLMRFRETGSNRSGNSFFTDIFYPLVMAYRRGDREETRRMWELLPEQLPEIPRVTFWAVEIGFWLAEYPKSRRYLEAIRSRSAGDTRYHRGTLFVLDRTLAEREGEKELAEEAHNQWKCLRRENSYTNLDFSSPEFLRLALAKEVTGREEQGGFLRLQNPVPALPEAPPRRDYHLLLLGEFRIMQGSENITERLVSQQRLKDLLMLLCARLYDGLAKEQVCRLLWPESGTEKAKINLNTLLYRFRKQFRTDSDPIRFLGETLLLNPEVFSSDLGRFDFYRLQAEKLEAREDFFGALELRRRAAELYRGHFLEGLSIFSLLNEVRETTIQEIKKNLLRIAQISLEGAVYSQAATAADHLIRIDPLCECGYRLQMICSLLLNQKNEIPRIMNRLEERLRKNYGIGADNKSREIYHDLMTGSPPRAHWWREEVVL